MKMTCAQLIASAGTLILLGRVSNIEPSSFLKPSRLRVAPAATNTTAPLYAQANATAETNGHRLGPEALPCSMTPPDLSEQMV